MQNRVEMCVASDTDAEITGSGSCGLNLERYENDWCIWRRTGIDLPSSDTDGGKEGLDALFLRVRESRLLDGGKATAAVVERWRPNGIDWNATQKVA